MRTRRTRQGRRERGSALIIVMLVVFALVSMGLIALQQTRTEQSTAGNLRASRQAYETAYAGLVRTAGVAAQAGYYMHREAVRNGLLTGTTPAYETGVARLPNPFENDAASVTTRDVERVRNLDYKVRMWNPRPAEPPPGFSVAGGTTRGSFYVYQFDVTGWVNKGAGDSVAPGSGGARKLLRAEVRVGPIVESTQ